MAINGDLQKFIWAQQIGMHATEFGLQLAAPKIQFDFTRGVVQAYAPQQGIEAARIVPFSYPAGNWQRDPITIQDRLTLEAAKGGEGKMIIPSLNDRPFYDMEKWSFRTQSADGRVSDVHYVKDPSSGALMDFKFNRSSQEGAGNYASKQDPRVGPGNKPTD